MAKITYNTHDNKTHTIEVQNGLTVMEGAVQNDIPGIDADCGGEWRVLLAMFMLMKNG
jgi:2Fe-2S ferredoxin